MNKKQILRTLGASILIGLTITLLSIFYTKDVANNIQELQDMRFGFPIGFVTNDYFVPGDSLYNFPETRSVSLDILDMPVGWSWLAFIGSFIINSVIVFLVLFLIYKFIPRTRKA